MAQALLSTHILVGAIGEMAQAVLSTHILVEAIGKMAQAVLSTHTLVSHAKEAPEPCLQTLLCPPSVCQQPAYAASITTRRLSRSVGESARCVYISALSLTPALNAINAANPAARTYTYFQLYRLKLAYNVDHDNHMREHCSTEFTEFTEFADYSVHVLQCHVLSLQCHDIVT